jgi:two-component system, OmpR family, response regulator
MRPPYPGDDHRLWEPDDAAGIPEDPEGRRILVVEDDAPIREVLVTTLRLSGYRVASVGEGVEAEGVALSFRPELVLMDLMLPDMDGWEITKRIKAHPQLGNPPVIVLSARVREVDRQRAFAAGAVHFLPKPCRASDLLEAVRSFLPELDGVEERSGLISVDEDELVADGESEPESLRSLEFEIGE